MEIRLHEKTLMRILALSLCPQQSNIANRQGQEARKVCEDIMGMELGSAKCEVGRRVEREEGI